MKIEKLQQLTKLIASVQSSLKIIEDLKSIPYDMKMLYLCFGDKHGRTREVRVPSDSELAEVLEFDLERIIQKMEEMTEKKSEVILKTLK